MSKAVDYAEAVKSAAERVATIYEKRSAEIVVPDEVRKAAELMRSTPMRHPDKPAAREVIAAWMRANRDEFSFSRLCAAIGLNKGTVSGWVAYGIDTGQKVVKVHRAKPEVHTRSFLIPQSDEPAPVPEAVPGEGAPVPVPVKVPPGKFILFVGDNDTLETAIRGLRDLFGK